MKYNVYLFDFEKNLNQKSRTATCLEFKIPDNLISSGHDLQMSY